MSNTPFPRGAGERQQIVRHRKRNVGSASAVLKDAKSRSPLPAMQRAKFGAMAYRWSMGGRSTCVILYSLGFLSTVVILGGIRTPASAPVFQISEAQGQIFGDQRKTYQSVLCSNTFLVPISRRHSRSFHTPLPAVGFLLHPNSMAPGL